MTGNAVLHCRDCQHWGRYYKGKAYWQDVGLCVLTVCKDEKPAHPNTLAFGGGMDDYCCWLDTKADFGCVQWAPKAEKEGAEGVNLSAAVDNLRNQVIAAVIHDMGLLWAYIRKLRERLSM